jgi:tripartite-type tricarboxylate transporter receptor subunit TctC
MLMFKQHLSTTILLVDFVGSACAQDYPVKPIRIISPFAAGGPADAPARWIAAKLTRSLGQQFIVDSRGGASTIIGTDLVAKSTSDGYTLLFTTVSFILTGVTAANPPFDPVRDFAPLTPVSNTASILVVGPALPVKSMRDLVEHARRNPGKVKYASSGTGGILHLYGELLKVMANVDMLHVPYKGGGPAAASVLGGEIEVSFVGLSGVLPLLKSGKIIPLAVASGARSPALPDVPTMAEAGIKGFEAVSSRYQMFAPAGTPEPVLSKLHAAIVEVVHAPDTHQQFSALGMEPFSSTRADHAVYVAAQIEFWKKIAHAAGMRPQ